MKLIGDRNQCPTCNAFFNSTHAFEKHRTGRVATSERRCMSVAEMTATGMAKNSAGFWVGSLMTRDAVDAMTSESISGLTTEA